MSGHSREKKILNPDFSDMLSALNAQQTEYSVALFDPKPQAKAF